MDLKAEIKAVEPEVVEIRRDIHRHPEMGKEEFRTAELVERHLGECGIRTQRLYNTGVLGILEGSKPGKTLLLRADMDALPVQEEADVPFKSESAGIMHACGHDTHVAMLLGAAKVLAAHRDDIAGTIKFVFQPDEEGAFDTGAGHMVAEGVLEDPRPDASFAMHIWTPLESGKIGITDETAMGECYSFRIVLKGKGGHSSSPHQAVDPVLCAAAIIQNTQAVQTREISLQETTVIMFCRVRAGDANNIIPDTAELEGTIRYMYDGGDDSPQQPRVRFQRMVEGICAAYRVEPEITFEPGSYAVVNDREFVNFLKKDVFPEVVAEDQVVFCNTLGGEDFSEYLNRNHVPGAIIFLGTGNPELGSDYPHHSPFFKVDESSLSTGVSVFVNAALKFLQA